MTGFTLLQASLVEQLPQPATVALAVVCILAGMTVPTRYGVERLEGFGRFVVSKLPYRSPPGVDEQEAMQQATDSSVSGSDGEEPDA